MLGQIVVATIIVGLVSFGGLLIIFRKRVKPNVMKTFVSLAAGTLLGAAFLDLLPAAIEESEFEPQVITGIALFSIVVFFLLERYLHWHHCRCDDHPEPHTHAKGNVKQHVVVTNLVGDALHNLIDGILIASAFLIDFQIGVVTTLAVIAHEIPQEVADFSVLLYAGLSKAKALLYNFFIALTAVAGALIFYYFGSQIEALVPIVATFAAGNFIYLAAADLIPELHHERTPRKIVVHSLWLLVGVGIIIVLGYIFPHTG